MNTDKTAKVLEKAFAEWRKIQTLKRGKTSIREFAEYLGYSQAAVGFWINGDRNISKEALLEIIPRPFPTAQLYVSTVVQQYANPELSFGDYRTIALSNNPENKQRY